MSNPSNREECRLFLWKICPPRPRHLATWDTRPKSLERCLFTGSEYRERQLEACAPLFANAQTWVTEPLSLLDAY